MTKKLSVLYWTIGTTTATLVLLWMVMYGASELGGEVVTLHRTEADGGVTRIRVWIVDQNDRSWIEHGAADSHWITLLSDSPEILLTREGQTIRYTGDPDPEAHALYHELRRRKYGWADQLIGIFSGTGADCSRVPVRLQPFT